MTNADDTARLMLRELDEALAGREPFLRQALRRLVPLHAEITGDDLPERAAIAERLALLHSEMAVFVARSAGAIDDARDEDLEDVLTLRSTLQYLTDDFRGTVADGVVDPEALVQIDDDLTYKLRDLGPRPDLEPPAGIPASHWWWAAASRRPDRGAG
ncbi:hypothetical protein ACQP2F_33975 [Actinoplanes sp. CA-030573]|uniref:hypothetical protein n=1 Tax=Actinoplanes sp. CA-030573 TaxID=3239898 RepID=UPI003D8B73B6